MNTHKIRVAPSHGVRHHDKIRDIRSFADENLRAAFEPLNILLNLS